jgi:hypothetical protein
MGGTPWLVANDLNGIAVRVQNNVAATTRIAGAGSPLVREGTDILTIRGVISTPIYQLNYLDTTTFVANFGGNPNFGAITIQSISPTGVTQNLQPWADAKAAGRNEAIVLTSPADDTLYAVVRFDPVQSSVNIGAGTAQIVFQSQGETISDAYKALNLDGLNYPAPPSIAYAGILEEYRFYIRDESLDPTDPVTTLSPRLSRGRFYPGRNAAWDGDDTNREADIADNIYDLQVALAIDTSADGTIATPEPPAAADEWLFNATADDATEERWEGGPRAATPPPTPNIYYLRINTMAMTDRRDPKLSSPPLGLIEDHNYAGTIFNTRAEKLMFRRRLQQTVVDMRNLG